MIYFGSRAARSPERHEVLSSLMVRSYLMNLPGTFDESKAFFSCSSIQVDGQESPTSHQQMRLKGGPIGWFMSHRSQTVTVYRPIKHEASGTCHSGAESGAEYPLPVPHLDSEEFSAMTSTDAVCSKTVSPLRFVPNLTI